MSNRIQKALHSILCTILVGCLLLITVPRLMLDTSGNERYFSGNAEIYYQELLDAGFPVDYAVSLTELHLLHPSWTFTPLGVTKLEAEHTWDYVIDQETRNESINLISKADTYAAYWHETNRNQPETGYYQPSRVAVSYFMDPRNFLNECDIFQFFDLSASVEGSLAAVNAVLVDTFMEGAMLENGKTYAQTFCDIGAELGINPVYLAVKVRQEQGVNGTSPIISGECGSLLWKYYSEQIQKTESGKDVIPPSAGYTESDLVALDGYYNYFNIDASGEGAFEIYREAMLRAMEGTPAFSERWGGSPAWNTRWKSLYGGAYFLKTSYIDRYQSTIYLQKFNVDSRSGRTFWGQYMASLPGAMNEGRTLYRSFASLNALDSPCTFLIPVYGNMPETASPDPANGSCTNVAMANTRYSYQGEWTSPARKSTSNEALYLELESYSYSKLSLKGMFTHSYGMESLEYRWDDGEWTTASQGNNFDFSLPTNFAENSSHILVIRGNAAFDHENAAKKSNVSFLCAVIYLTVLPSPTVHLTYEIANTQTVESFRAGTEISLPTCSSPDFSGWVGSDGSFLPSGGTFRIEKDISYRAVFLTFHVLKGAALALPPNQPSLCFFAAVEPASYAVLDAIPNAGVEVVAAICSEQGERTERIGLEGSHVGDWLFFHANTEPLSPASYRTDYTVSFGLIFSYTDGTSRTVSLQGPEFTRTAAEVAAMAIADTSVTYPPAELAFLYTLTTQS
ncbi:MAG: hypothetical protein IKA05_08465 [Clostridia bacterium]|nr:hypothetical protein [Clostridia bacterium]